MCSGTAASRSRNSDGSKKCSITEHSGRNASRGVKKRREKACCAGLLQSPLPDSNRRPPPYHPGSPASEGNHRRLVARNRGGFEAAVFAVICGGLRPLCSTNAPYRPALVVEVDHFPRRGVVFGPSSRWSNFPG